MRKVKEVLRLRFGLGLQQNQIAGSCSIGQATVHRYLQKAAAAGLTWPLPEGIDDRRLEELLFPMARSGVPARPRGHYRILPKSVGSYRLTSI
jgi:hypothetical protein